MKHTPGPWEGSNEIKSHNGTIVCEVFATDNDAGKRYGKAESDYNARLIAAAPELLEACYRMLNVEGPAVRGCKSGPFKDCDVSYHFDRLRAAIAKATGGE